MTKQLARVRLTAKSKPLPVKSSGSSMQAAACRHLIDVQLILNGVDNNSTLPYAIRESSYGHADIEGITLIRQEIVITQYALQRAAGCRHNN